MFKQSIRDLMFTRYQPGDIGLELEIEGANLPRQIPKFWHGHEDGSLRGEACEYTLSRPIAWDKAQEALAVLDKAFKDNHSVLNLSRRTSVHVHVNVQRLCVQQIYTLIALEFILDNLLVEYGGPDRIGNLFCLRAQDAEYLPLCVTQGLRSGKFFDFTNDNIRYASMNLTALRNYGSLEFRSFRGCADPAEIGKWISILKTLYDRAQEYNDPREMIQDYFDVGPVEFLRKNTPEFFFDVASDFTRWRTSLENGATYAFEIAYATNDWVENIKDHQKKMITNIKYQPGDFRENDPRFADRSQEWIDFFLNYERDRGEFVKMNTGAWRNTVEYVERELRMLEETRLIEADRQRRRERERELTDIAARFHREGFPAPLNPLGPPTRPTVQHVRDVLRCTWSVGGVSRTFVATEQFNWEEVPPPAAANLDPFAPAVRPQRRTTLNNLDLNWARAEFGAPIPPAPVVGNWDIDRIVDELNEANEE